MIPTIKKFSIAVALNIITITLFAQTVSQGVWMAGGSAGFSSSKQDGAGNSTTIVDVIPSVGYFIIDNLSVGLNITYSSTSLNNSTLTSLAFGPWARYYVIPNAFAQSGFNMGTNKINGDFGKATTKNSSMYLGLGYSAWLSNSVALEPIAYYNIQKEKDESDDVVRTNSFGLSIGFQVFLGRE